MEKLVQQCKALGDPTRFAMLKMLQDGELCVCEFAERLSLAQSTVSRHLSLLRAAGLVEARKEGQWLYCRLPDTSEDASTSTLLGLVQDSNADHSH